MSQPLTVKTVLEPLSRRFPMDPEKQAERVQEFVALFMEYMAQQMGRANGTLIIGQAQDCLQAAKVKRPAQVIDEVLKAAGYFKINSTPTPAALSPADVVAAQQARLEELRPLVKRVLESEDPLRLAVEDIRSCGYGGDTTAVETTYIVATTRLLPNQPGHMPCHTAHVSASGEGKSYAVNRVLAMLPPCAYCVVESGSPKSFVYDLTPLTYRVLFFSEIDALPEGEDNPLASGIRTLLAEGRMRYTVVEKNPITNRMEAREIIKEGPTVLLTTATRSLDGKQGSQMDTRLFSISLPETREQHAAALKVIAKQTNAVEPQQPNPALIAFQEYLQLLAPWRVVIPYADALYEFLGLVAERGRIMRDFMRLLSFIKAAAVLRHTHRERTPEGAIVATFGDYETVRRLLGQVFVGAATGAPDDLRLVVETVAEAVKKGFAPISLPDLQQSLSGRLNPQSVYRYVVQSLKSGWLVNDSETKKQWALNTGSPLPAWAGLPTVEALQAGPPPTVPREEAEEAGPPPPESSECQDPDTGPPDPYSEPVNLDEARRTLRRNRKA